MSRPTLIWNLTFWTIRSAGHVVHILTWTQLQAVAATVQYRACNFVPSANNTQPASLHQNSSCLGSTVVPQAETVKYLGLHFDKRLTWKNHVTTKRKQLDLKTREIYWLIRKHSHLSLEKKLLIYKTVLKPVWRYGIELWGCATRSNIAVIQRYQSKLLRSITNAPWYVSNQNLHSDLHNPHVRTVFRERTATHHTTLDSNPNPLMERTATHHTALDSHPNPLMEPLVHPPHNRRLKRRWTSDEIHLRKRRWTPPRPPPTGQHNSS